MTTISEALKKNYDTYYDADESDWRRITAIQKVDNVVRLARKVQHRKILEIGAGEGALLQGLSERAFGEELAALEISSSGVAAIERKNIPRLKDCLLFDGYNIPFGERAYDVAVLSHVIEHVEHPRKLITEAARVARHVFIEVPLEDTLRLPENYRFDRLGHINHYSPRTIRYLVQSTGLSVLEQLVINPSKEAYLFRNGRKGVIDHFIKETLLRLSPGVATKCFTYHSALLCELQT